MFYAIQNHVFKEHNFNKLITVLNELELDYEVIDYLPFAEGLSCKTTRKDVFCFGSAMIAKLAYKMGWFPGSFYGYNHDFMVYKEFYRDNLLNYDSIVININESIIWENSNEVKFIRPCKDSKLFTGGLFTKIKWEDKLNSIQQNVNLITDISSTFIQVNSPKLIYKEARVWIIDGKIVTSSYYSFNQNTIYEENVDPEGLHFVKNMILLYQVAEAFVMDICLTTDGWKIVEINCINCSGFYKGNLGQLILALENKYN